MRLVSKPEALAFLEADRARMGLRPRDCVMCMLARRDWEPALIVAESAHALVRVNRIPSRPNEMMVVLREHRERVGEVEPHAYAAMFELARRAGSVLEEHHGALRVFVAQLGSPEDILLSCPHIHVHVLPLTEGGESARPSKVFSWSERVYAYDDGEAEAVAASLRASL